MQEENQVHKDVLRPLQVSHGNACTPNNNNVEMKEKFVLGYDRCFLCVTQNTRDKSRGREFVQATQVMGALGTVILEDGCPGFTPGVSVIFYRHDETHKAENFIERFTELMALDPFSTLFFSFLFSLLGGKISHCSPG